LRIKERQRSYDVATLVESFVILNAVGAECVDDFSHMREDAGLSEMGATGCRRHRWRASF
jgi:hypothetical protein